MGGLDSLDWSSIKFETQKMESQLGDWLLNGEVKYLQGWAFAFAERKAEYLGIPLNCKRYFQLQTMTRSKVFKKFYKDFQERMNNSPSSVMGLKHKLPKYTAIDHLVEEEVERLTRPEEGAVKSSNPSFNDELNEYISAMECCLSEYVSEDEIALLRNASLEYAEEKAKKLKLVRGSPEYRRLHIAAKYELLCEAEESLIGFSSDSLDFSIQLVRDLAENNDLDRALGEYESRAFGKS